MENRVIKFRQPIVKKDGSFSEWFYWGDISPKDWIEPAIHLNGIDTRRQSQQFSGLHDKNGKEIYEGDVLRHTVDERLLNWVVVFKNGCFGIRNIGADGYVNHAEFYPCNSEYYFRDREVIGNIFQNPELLTNV